MSHRQATAITTLAAAAALSAGPAFAQQQVNNSGRAHDANPQVGSGGRNDTVGGQALDYRQRNDIITGNVTGGFEFRGNIDYTAPGEFQGNLGSDDLFRFNARSFQSAPTSLSGTAPSVNLGGVPSVYRGFSTPTAGAGVINAQAYQLTRVAPNNGATTYAQITGTNPYNYTNAATSVRDAANQLGYTTLEGQTFAVTASPLLGIRQDQIPQPNLPGQSLNVNLEVPGTVRPQTAPGLDPTQPTPAHRLTPEEEAERTANDPRIQARLGTEPFRPLLTEDYRRQVLGIGPDGMPIGPEAAQGTQDPNAVRDGGVNQSGQITPTRVMGQQLQGMLRGSGRGGERDLAAEQRLNRVGEDLMNRAAQQQSQGRQSAYGQLLEQVQRTPGDRQAPGRPGAPGDPLTPNLADPMNPLDAIQNEQVIQAEIDRMKALDRVYGNRPGTVGSDSRAARDPLNAAQGSEAMQQLLNQLNYEAAPLRTLSGEEEGQVSRLLRQAEQALASGQYFDAETLYRQVISISPADPMPRIGLVHAQLGPG